MAAERRFRNFGAALNAKKVSPPSLPISSTFTLPPSMGWPWFRSLFNQFSLLFQKSGKGGKFLSSQGEEERGESEYLCGH